MNEYNATHKCKWLLATSYNIRHYEDGTPNGVWQFESAYDHKKLLDIRYCPYCGMQLEDDEEDTKNATVSRS